MAIVAKESSGKAFEPIPAGTYMAICYSVIDLGVQINEKFNVKSRRVMLTWETPDETIEIEGEQRPKVISKEYTLSLSERAALRKDLEAWRGKVFTKEELEGFDLQNILGKACQLQIIHKTSASGNIRAGINAIMGLPKGYSAPSPTNNQIYFDLTNIACVEQMDTLPEWIQGKIRQSETWQELTKPPLSVVVVNEDDNGDDGMDDLPF